MRSAEHLDTKTGLEGEDDLSGEMETKTSTDHRTIRALSLTAPCCYLINILRRYVYWSLFGSSWISIEEIINV